MVMDLAAMAQFIQECFPVGCVPSAAVAVSGGGGVSAQGWCLPRGVSAHGGVHFPSVDIQTLLTTLPFRNYCCGR